MANSLLHIAVDHTSVCEGDEFIVHVLVDASEAINAVQGTFRYDPTHLTPVSVRYGDSFLRYWVVAPDLPMQGGVIPFTGGVPYPGFQGADGKVMSIVFRADTADVSTPLTVDRDAQVLLNDGEGTSTDTTYGDVRVQLIERSALVCQAGPTVPFEETDTTPPAPFSILIERTEKAFDGRYFAIFDTTDAETGISYYEVRETSSFIRTPWQRSESPYLLRTQGGEVLVEVHAVDGAGNIRLASVSWELQPYTPLLETPVIFLLIGASAVVIALWLFCRRK